jgi:uncharacterized membrane protein SpoIIM required for sporulation
LIAFAVFIGIFLVSYTIGNFYKMSEEDTKNFAKDLSSSTAGIGAIGIFLHNSSVSLPMFIPGFGAAWGAFIGWQTGAAFEALKATNSSLSNMPAIALLLGSPFGVLELGAYSLGMSRRYLLIWRIVKRNPIKKEIRPTLIEIGISIGILIIAAVIESSMIVVPKHVSLSA